MAKTYRREDGFLTSDLLHYGRDHLASAKALFDRSYQAFDSAGYLSHLGVELLLKALLLDLEGEFPNEHDLWKLVRRVRIMNTGFLTDPEDATILTLINSFSSLRYPIPEGGQTIGDEHWSQIERLCSAIVAEMPARLQHEIQDADPTTKGGRILMSRPK